MFETIIPKLYVINHEKPSTYLLPPDYLATKMSWILGVEAHMDCLPLNP